MIDVGNGRFILPWRMSLRETAFSTLCVRESDTETQNPAELRQTMSVAYIYTSSIPSNESTGSPMAKARLAAAVRHSTLRLIALPCLTHSFTLLPGFLFRRWFWVPCEHVIFQLKIGSSAHELDGLYIRQLQRSTYFGSRCI